MHPDIAEVVEKSSISGVNKAQLVGNEDGASFVPLYDWQSFFSKYFTGLPGIKALHHCHFPSAEPGVVYTKTSTSDEECRVQLLKNPDQLPPSQLPIAIPPPGLNYKRRSYLYEKIREFCHEKRS